MNYAGRLISGTLVVLVITVVVLVVGVERAVRRDLENETRAALAREAALVRATLPADTLLWQDVVTRLGEDAGIRVTLIDAQGRVRAESETTTDELAVIENHASRPEVIAALQGGTGADSRSSATVGRRFMYLAVPGGPGAVRVAMSLEQVDQAVARAQRPVLIAAAVALLLGITLASIAGRRFAQPLEEIATAARDIARGATPRFPFSGIPDVDRLTADLRAMSDQLTERFESLRRKQSETSAIVDSMVEGVLSSDDRGRIITANPAARRLLGYSDLDQLPDLPLLFRGKDARETLGRVLDGAAIADREITLNDRTYLLNARPLPAGGAVVVLHDLTHLKRLETVRRDFVANVSHELKTPLTAISGYTETLLADQPDPEIRQQFLETILSNARRMQRLVDDQLDLSRIEAGNWTPRPEVVAIEPAAREAWTLAASRHDHPPGLSFAAGPDAADLFVDHDAVRQIFRNLFENAVRHTPPSGSVSVVTRRDGLGIEVTVRDTGVGIASEHLPRIFERFYRVDPGRSRDQGGTGLGLAIVKHLVEGHGGRIRAESELGRGTAISFWIPASRPESAD